LDSDIVLGVDPGLGITGYGLVAPGSPAKVVEAGAIRTGEGMPLSERVRRIHEALTDIMGEFSPGAVAIEELYSHYAHPRTAILMGHARGVVLLAAAEQGLAVFHYAATRIKRSLTGYGHASKVQMQRAVQNALGLAEAPEPPDVADALATALCHLHALAHGPAVAAAAAPVRRRGAGLVP